MQRKIGRQPVFIAGTYDTGQLFKAILCTVSPFRRFIRKTPRRIVPFANTEYTVLNVHVRYQSGCKMGPLYVRILKILLCN
jgi:hypothetical protein